MASASKSKKAKSSKRTQRDPKVASVQEFEQAFFPPDWDDCHEQQEVEVSPEFVTGALRNFRRRVAA